MMNEAHEDSLRKVYPDAADIIASVTNHLDTIRASVTTLCGDSHPEIVSDLAYGVEFLRSAERRLRAFPT
jgi:hypothetical protein